ncbi:MAG: TonB-dependent receptor plug domain-containing protein [Chlorobi bacterium]|nr:TonB-dependent receptor plug domain-containing protein [Chlorobiota bacterium]
MKKSILNILLIFISVFVAKAQDMSEIRGTITDGETGEPLIGAIIRIENTEPPVVTVSDLYGNFSLENVPADAKKMLVSFLSYETKIINNLNLPAGGVKIINLVLEKTASQISEVLISAKSLTNTEAAIITYRKKSAGPVNGISSQQISELGDSDAAAVLKRVSGISVTDGKYIFVRGLSDRYSKITLNGAEIPGLDPNKNTVQTDIFPASIIDNIIVHKSFTPDLPASFTGGYVNISTKAYPETFILNFTTSAGYNPQANLRNDFLSYEGGNLDFAGFDDGTRNLPDEASGVVPPLYADNDKLDKITASFNKIMETSHYRSFLNQSHSFSVGNRIKLFGKPFGFFLSANYKINYTSYDNGIYGRYNLVESENGNMMNILISEKEIKGDEEAMLSLLAGFSFKVNENNGISVMFLGNSDGLKTARYREGQKTEDNLYMHEHVLGFLERRFLSGQVSGKHILPGFNKTELNWISSYTFSEQNEPDLRFFNYDGKDGSYNISYNAYPSPARFYRDLSEINSDTKIHLTIPSGLLGGKLSFKTGGAFTYKSRVSDSRKFDVLSQGLPFNGDIKEYLSDENTGQNADDAVYGIYVSNDPLTDDYNSYKAKEYISAIYVTAISDLSDRIKVITGARFENSYTEIKNNVSPFHFKYVSSEKIYPDILPVFNVRYSLSGSSILRFVYAKTVARPSFRETAPYAYYDFKEGVRVVGNPELKRTSVDNIDLRFEFFGKSNDMFSAGIFSKFFSDPIELVDDPRANNPEFHYVNADNSTMYGFEIEFKKNFAFAGLPNFSAGANYTLLQSYVEYVDNYGGEDNTVLSVKRPMYGQSPQVLNLFADYNNKEKGLNVNLAFNAEGKKLAVVTKGSVPNIYKQTFPDLKLNIAKSFGRFIKLKLSVNNILDSDNKKTYTYEGKEYIFHAYGTGRTYSFSVSYSIR